MKLRIRLALIFSGMVALILIVMTALIYMLYADFRKDEFFLRLEEKAITTSRLLLKIKQEDYELLRILDQSSINAYYQEKVLIFDNNNKLIYSSLDDHSVNYSDALLQKIRNNKKIIYEDEENEVIGIYLDEQGRQDVIIVSAFDKYGKRNLKYLLFILLLAVIAGLILTAALSFFYVNQTLKPLEALSNQVTRITEENLDETIPTGNSDDELTRLASNFNLMLNRLSNAFELQKSFVHSASHELRTPLANIMSQLEAAMNKNLTTEEYQALLQSVYEDHNRLSKLVNSLLILSTFENIKSKEQLPAVRIDEILFKAIDELKFFYGDMKVQLDFEKFPEEENDLIIKGNEILLKSAFNNLLENAYKYSTDKTVHVVMTFDAEKISIKFTNTGNIIQPEEEKNIFEPFMRGKNSGNKKGFGLGLAITQRIVHSHQGNLSYQNPSDNTNVFVLELPR